MCPYRAAESQGVPVTQDESFPDSLSGYQAPYSPASITAVHCMCYQLLSRCPIGHTQTIGIPIDSRPVSFFGWKDWGDTTRFTKAVGETGTTHAEYLREAAFLSATH